MARPKREKKAKPEAEAQMPLPASTPELRVLPMELKAGDRITDAAGAWEVVGRSYTTNQGKTAHVRVRRVDQPDVTQIRTWGAHERIAVKRTGGA